MSIGSGNGSPFSIKNVVSAATWLVQAAVLGIVTFMASWMSSQTATNTQTAISINSLTNKLEERNNNFIELKARYEKMDERLRLIEIRILGGQPAK